MGDHVRIWHLWETWGHVDVLLQSFLPTGYKGKIGCPNLLPRVKSQDSGTLSSARGTRALNLNAAFTTKELVRLFTRLSRRKSILSAQILLKKKIYLDSMQILNHVRTSFDSLVASPD